MPPPFDDDGAGAALAVVAALLGAGQAQVFAQRVEQGGARVEFKGVLGAIDVEYHLGHHRWASQAKVRLPRPPASRRSVGRWLLRT